MLYLAFKDITIPKGAFVTALIYCLTGNLFFINTPAFIYVVLPPFIAYSYINNSCNYDYRYNSDIMFNSLPLNRKDLVLSKYIGSIVFFILGIIITIIFTFIFRSIGVSGSGVSGFIHINRLMHLDMVDKLMNFERITMSYIVSTILLISIYFPIYFKFEYLKVRNIFAVASIFICLIPILFIKIIGNENTYNLANYLNSGSRLIANVAVICILLLILYISVNISVEFYQNRDL